MNRKKGFGQGVWSGLKERSETGIDETWGDFPGGAAVKNPPASTGDTGSSPGPGRSHMPRSS